MPRSIYTPLDDGSRSPARESKGPLTAALSGRCEKFGLHKVGLMEDELDYPRGW